MISLWWPISPIKKIVCFTHGKPQELSRIRLGMYAGWTSGHHDTRVFQSLNNRDRHGSTPNKLQIEQIKSPQNHDLHKMATCLGFKQIQMPWRKKKPFVSGHWGGYDIYWDSRFSIQFLEVWLGSHALAMENPIKDPYVSLCHDVLMRCFCLNVDETKNKTGKIYVSEEDHW